jgi:hypothetical protein
MTPEESTQHEETGVTGTIMSELTRCYERLTDWGAAEQWLGSQTETPSALAQASSKYKDVYMHALLEFERKQYTAVRTTLAPSIKSATATPAEFILDSLAQIRSIPTGNANNSRSHGQQQIGDMMQRLANATSLLQPMLTSCDPSSTISLSQLLPALVQLNSIRLLEQCSSPSAFLTIPLFPPGNSRLAAVQMHLR